MIEVVIASNWTTENSKKKIRELKENGEQQCCMVVPAIHTFC